MPELTLAEIAQVTGGRLSEVADPEARVTGPVAEDTRRLGPGGLFAAFEGERVDGHDYAEAAVAAGAVAVLGRRPVGVPAVVVDDVQTALGALARAVVRRLPDCTVIALTGSSGKTSTKDLLAQVLAAHGPTTATPGSRNNEIGLPITVLNAAPDTRHLVLEMGARGIGHIAYLTGLVPPTVGIVLNVGAAHMGEFGGKEATARAKGELVEALPSADLGGVAILNADDPLVAAMAARTRASVLFFGRGEGTAVRAEDVRMDDAGRARFTLVTPEGAAPVELGLYGEHHVSNALAAAAAAHTAGMSTTAIARALTAARALSQGRMQVTTRADGVTIVNDAFNANPDSARAALRALAAMPGRRRVAVLGEMAELGDTAPDQHEAVGAFAAQSGADLVVAVGGTDAARLEQGARSAGAATHLAPDVPAALLLLEEQLATGDIVLVKSSKASGLLKLAEALQDADQAATD
ncbi:UDP-N-acetylmuramoyl-tripeptide--D-alanyl-D-alanine ligase [Allonocardiopsis opalescens]|uniref:UDP-N-acetylmuramoyl-tripeptide--D-alanyl-D-alanine ligase n=1 Tax=Allonocardiopsis opalescens TaxID=1144618 RepID=A0A2T0QB07_9ACTN|nr:UDP-N-acetylmuramoyl-tripeptide--D-alanyl-D-alanine ligase [Allonocardiopsis opalescens]PRY01000.1 UDP-N-acetylmuramoyl-tripeptide--D-alanyl-D-alanine ligase [Allonocardiopsis opalescens]